MAYIVINYNRPFIQLTIIDFIIGLAFEVIDYATPEGKERFKDISAPLAPLRRKPQMSTHLFKDIRFLCEKVLNERDRRLFAGFLLRSKEFGGTKKVSKLTGLDMKTVRKGREELIDRLLLPDGRIRHEGGGRPTKTESEPRYEPELKALIEDDVAGDPMIGKKWVRKTVRWMKEQLAKKNIHAAISTIRDTLKKLGISLKKNIKSKSSRAQRHPDREKQFGYLNKFKHFCLASGIPVISVDTKKKELIGNFKNDGRTWRKEAKEVLDHDFPSLAKGKLIPYGIYDLKHNNGYVYCGTTYDTSEFAVDSICRWWKEYGQKLYPNQSQLLILCDSGGSNGYRRRLWKWALQTKLADRFGLTVHVCHYPSGASKYNPIERKLFSFISKNWAGEPLTNYKKALDLIETTTTAKGLKVTATLAEKEYRRGIKVSKEQMESLAIKRVNVCPNWNYCISPR